MRLSTIFYGLAVLLAIGVSVVSLHYFLFGARFAPPIIAPNFAARPLFFLLHVGGGVIALTTGIWQFLPRTRRGAWHRLAGRVYVAACLLGGTGGFFLALGSAAGPVAQSGFGVLAVIWIAATWKAYRAIRAGDIASHRVWMWRSYGLTAAAITLRIILPVGAIAGVPFESLYPATAWACWISSLAIAEATRVILDARPAPIAAGS